jgi:histidine triad (HIT) family protein
MREAAGVPSVFTRIIDGELPGHFVWRDDRCVAFLSIAPLQPGHTLVVPRVEVDHWIDLDPGLNAHLVAVAQEIGRAQQEVFRPARIGLMIAGLEVPHVHLHVVPIRGVHDLDFGNARHGTPPEELADAAARLRAGLRASGAAGVSD